MKTNRNPMNSLERRAVSGLASIYALRLMGLFLILPVFAIYAEQLQGHTPLLIGLALGVYGLTQALLQIPLGVLSDHIGRKPVIAGGLLVFALGSVIAAMADAINWVIVGRALQGAGAIAAATLALAADLTRDNQRTKAMAIIGVTIGAAFILSLILGSVLNKIFGVPGIFWLTAGLAVLGLFVLYLWIPTPAVLAAPRPDRSVFKEISEVIKRPELMRLNVGIFVLHCVLTALFVVVPIALLRNAGINVDSHWQIYVPVMLGSAVFLIPLIYLSDSKGLIKQVFPFAVFMLLAAELILYQNSQTLMSLVAGLFLFFVAFNYLEATIPSLLSRSAPAARKGTAMGVYTTFEFIGAFVGGVAGGWCYGEAGMAAVFLASAALLLVWFAITLVSPHTPLVVSAVAETGQSPPQ